MARHARILGFLLLGTLAGPACIARADAISSIRDLGAGVSGLLLNNNGDVAGMRPDPSGQSFIYGFSPTRGFVDRSGVVTPLDPSILPVHLDPDGTVVDGRGPLTSDRHYGISADNSYLIPTDPIAGNDKGQFIGTASSYRSDPYGNTNVIEAGYVYTPYPPVGDPARYPFQFGDGQTLSFHFPATSGIVHVTYLNAINNSGTLAGGYMREDQTRAADGTIQYAWSTNAFVGDKDIAKLVGGDYSIVTALNNKGDAVGLWGVGGGYNPFFYKDGAVSGLKALAGSADSSSDPNLSFYGGRVMVLHAINDLDQVVGQSALYGNQGALYVATLWDAVKGTVIDLNSLLPKASGWALTDAVGINDVGQIVGYGTFDGQEHGFLLNLDGQIQPVPEPTTMAVICLAGGLFALRRRKALG